jgi:hypothetical protein
MLGFYAEIGNFCADTGKSSVVIQGAELNLGTLEGSRWKHKHVCILLQGTNLKTACNCNFV